jgi:hypothetical protein
MTDYGRDVEFGYFLTPNTDDGATSNGSPRAYISGLSVTQSSPGASSTPPTVYSADCFICSNQESPFCPSAKRPQLGCSIRPVW